MAAPLPKKLVVPFTRRAVRLVFQTLQTSRAGPGIICRHPMTADMLITLCTLAAAALLLVTNLVRSDVVGILVLLSLHLGGVLSVQEALSGFSSQGVIIIAAMFLVSEAIVYTGIGQRIGVFITQHGGTSEKRLVILLMAASGLLGAFMSSTATVAIFLPITMALASKAGLNHRRLLIPLAASSLISGMMTLVATTPNIVINNLLREHQLEPLSFFSYTPYGIAVLIAAILFMAWIGQDLLTRDRNAATRRTERSISELLHGYGIDQRWHLLRIPLRSSLIGKTVAQVHLREEHHVKLIALYRGGSGHSKLIPVVADTVFAPNDLVMAIGEGEWAEHFRKAYDLTVQPLPRDPATGREFLQVIGAAEVMLTPESSLVGKSVREIGFNTLFRCMVIGIRRQGSTITANLSDMLLKFGDVLLVVGAWSEILRLREYRSQYLLLTLPDDYREVVPAQERAPLTLLILGAMVVSMVFNLTSNVVSVLGAATALVLLRCVNLGGIYQAIEWKTIILIAGIMPLALAMQKSGLVDMASTAMLAPLQGQPPIMVLAGLFLTAVLLGLFLSNTPVAILVTPVALKMSLTLDISPQACAMTVAIACSAAFLSPFGSPVNMLVREPGGYGFLDFMKVGIPLVLISMAITLTLVYFFYFHRG